MIPGFRRGLTPTGGVKERSPRGQSLALNEAGVAKYRVPP